MKKFLLGLLIGIFIPALSGVIFLLSGGMPVATKGPALPMEKLIAGTALHVAIKGQEGKASPLVADEVNLLAGAKIYMNQCAVCHGLNDGHSSFIAKGLFPQPPQLLEKDHGVTDDPIGESYWKIKNGIRLTGMPGFVDNLSETELWQVSELLVNADKLPPIVTQSLVTQSLESHIAH